MNEKVLYTKQSEIWIIVGLLLFAFGLRLLSLDNFPPGLRYDELQNHLMANRVIAGERPLYFAESWGHEPLYHYGQAFFLALLGQSDWALRIASVYTGVLSVAAIWVTTRKLFGQQTALLATAVTTIAFWSIFYSRIGSRVGTTTLFITLAVYCLWQIWTRPSAEKWKSWLMAVVGGLFMAAGTYTYVAGRVSFGIWAGFVLYTAVFHRRLFKRKWSRLLIMGMTGALLVLPLFWTLQQTPGLEQRLDLLNLPLDALKAGDPSLILDLTQEAWGMYILQGEQDWLYNVSGRPIFDIVTAVFFLFGIGITVWRWRKPEYALVLIWLLMGTAPAMLAPPEASLTHTIAAQPAAFILLAIGLVAVWQKFNQYNTRLGPAFASLVILFYGLTSFQAYFIIWNNNPEAKELYQAGITAVADEISANPPPGPIAIGAPFINYWHPWNVVNFDLATSGDNSQVRWFNPAGGWVWPAGSEPTTYFFPTNPLGKQSFEAELSDLFQANAVELPAKDGDYSAYQVAEPIKFDDLIMQMSRETNIAYPPDLAHLEPPELPLSFDNQLALIAVKAPEVDVAPGESLMFLTFWQALQANAPTLVAFTHLTDDGQGIWGQQDWLDVSTSSLQTGDRFAQIHTITVNPETPPGRYYLQIGLYQPDTLARLPILPDGADRVWVGTITVKARE